MEQRSDVLFRAEKLYKNSREKFGYLLREVVSNSIHATIMRQQKHEEVGYRPLVTVDITKNDSFAEIEVSDNGEGFTDENRKYFTHLDSRNLEKERLHFHPKGQGRLAIVYFSDYANYTSTYRAPDGRFRRKSFNYPEPDAPLFDIESEETAILDDVTTGTLVTLKFIKQPTFGRATTFFNKFSELNTLRNWFIETFFPFFIENSDLTLRIDLNGLPVDITKSFIETNINSVPFLVPVDNSDKAEYEFRIWLLKKEEQPRTKNAVVCFARHLRAELDEGKIEYEVDLDEAYDWFLTSEYLDVNVDQKGDKIEIPVDSVARIQACLNSVLDNYFRETIDRNRSVSTQNIVATKAKYHSLSVFIDNQKGLETKKVMKEAEIVGAAIELKGKAEKEYWSGPENDSEEIGKLLNSSLQIYIDHRRRVLDRFHGMIERFGADGDEKTEAEDDVHDLFLKRGQTLRDSSNTNHLHNLWILDDKYTVFSETFKGLSTRRGQELTDIYLWTDDPDRIHELLILELKSTSSAHNAGDKYESMVAQVKRYATQFYRDPSKVLNWSVDPSSILYSGAILARKRDVIRELNSNSIGGLPHKIPFLESSYFFNEQFTIGSGDTASPTFKEIRIEMYSYEDLHELASNRNRVFMKLLSGEYRIGDNPDPNGDLR